ncbi:hypothetical protein NIES4071_94090 [Calothrix sp. NIES-4071]|nr:hypothetical protein NIES4071_94090 [Calothrix sp. NIES-4071]BAZ63674.1 hypothetical protein NIES4105_94020 [Calothrix sp. NIES-4105]
MLNTYTQYKIIITTLRQLLGTSTGVLGTSTSVLISFLTLIVMLYFLPVKAQTNQVDSGNIRIHFNTNEPDGSSQGRPSGRKGTGSRGDCPNVEMPLTALVPIYNSRLAIEENPTLWFYIPFQSHQVSSSEFSLQDETKNDVMRTTFNIPSQPGIFGLKLKTAKPLEINKTYQWYFKLYCQTSKSSIPIFVSGSLRRMPLSSGLEKQLKAATTPRGKIAVYAQTGIWYTALNELAALRIAEPRNPTLQQDWTNLLTDVNLKDLANKPIVGELKN